MDREYIKSIIPHRDPFLLVDELTLLEPGVKASGILNVDDRLEALKGHFPGYPVMPGVLIVEAMAQVGACAILSMPEYKGRIALFGGIDKARFRKQVQPGDTLEMTVEMESLRRSAGKGKGVAIVNGKVACEVNMLFLIGE